MKRRGWGGVRGYEKGRKGGDLRGGGGGGEKRRGYGFRKGKEETCSVGDNGGWGVKIARGMEGERGKRRSRRGGRKK